MLDFFLRALLHPIDYLGLLIKHRVSFIEHNDEGNGTHSFIFESKTPITWKAGQHSVFTFPNKKITGKKWRAFSIASSAAEKQIRITTTIPDKPSDFKQKLQELSLGDTIVMHGPFGEFHTHTNGKKIIGIAGGVGITPFRAIAYEIANNINTNSELELIYAGKNNYFAFKEEFDGFAAHPQITIHYVNTPDEVNAKIEDMVNRYANSAMYFISGSPGMIAAIKKHLRELGIISIINDPFKGY